MKLLERFTYTGQFALENLLPGLRGQTIGSNLTAIDLSGVGTLTLPSQTLSDGSNIIVGSTTGTEIGTATTQKIGFCGVTPVVQPASPTGNVHTVAAGATTAVYVNTSFDGTLGTTAYTIGDIVVALKNLGILAL